MNLPTNVILPQPNTSRVLTGFLLESCYEVQCMVAQHIAGVCVCNVCSVVQRSEYCVVYYRVMKCSVVYCTVL